MKRRVFYPLRILFGGLWRNIYFLASISIAHSCTSIRWNEPNIKYEYDLIYILTDMMFSFLMLMNVNANLWSLLSEIKKHEDKFY